jgi:hypothetical protein
MRFVRVAFIFIVLIVQNGLSQQFYKSTGFNLFNRGEYVAAIDSMKRWTKDFPEDAGIAYYFIGESNYNLGFSSQGSISNAVSLFRESLDYFNRSIRQPDLERGDPDKPDEAKYKMAWCHFRIAELGQDPAEELNMAGNVFSQVRASNEDSLEIYASYMLGESIFQSAKLRYIRMLSLGESGLSLGFAQEIVQSFNSAVKAFKDVERLTNVSYQLKNSARIRWRDSIFEIGKLFQSLSLISLEENEMQSILSTYNAKEAKEAAVNILQSINYQSILDSMDTKSQVMFKSILLYSEINKNLQLYLLTGTKESESTLDKSIIDLQQVDWKDDISFIRACRDHRSSMNRNILLRLSNIKASHYSKAASTIPEALYWLGWIQLVANNAEKSEEIFKRFLNKSNSIQSDPYIAVLREDAQYRLFLLRFERNPFDMKNLMKLKNEIGRLKWKNYYISQKADLLLLIVRLGLNDLPWEVIRDEDKKLISFIFIRTSCVFSEERENYQTYYLDRIFRITEHQDEEFTKFFRGLSLFLKAQIQGNEINMRLYYLQAARELGRCSGIYRWEALYVQARSYFAASQHAENEKEEEELLKMAKDLFIQLINEKQSTRSVYYLGEIFHSMENDLSAKKCYEVVIHKTESNEEGIFLYENALSGLESCGSSGETSELKLVKIDDVKFPDSLFVFEGEVSSFEKLADPKYVRRQYWEESIEILMRFGLQKKILYPSFYRLTGSIKQYRTFKNVTAGIRERRGRVLSGLRILVEIPASAVHQEVQVLLNNIPLKKSKTGFYQKKPLPINEDIRIEVKNLSCYPHIRKILLLQPGMEQHNVYMYTKTKFIQDGKADKSEIGYTSFGSRTDGTIVLHSNGRTISKESVLYKDFQSDIKYRDFVFTENLDGYLTVHCEKNNLLFYGQDSMISLVGKVELNFPDNKRYSVPSIEGIDIDSRGNIYLVDWGNNMIWIFRNDGKYIRSFGGPGINSPDAVGTPVHFIFPTYIAIIEDEHGILINDEIVYRDPKILVADRNGIHLMDDYGVYMDTFFHEDNKSISVCGLAVKGYGLDTVIYIGHRKADSLERYRCKPSVE